MKKGNKEIILQINQEEAIVLEDGVEKKITLDTVPMILENRTMVPLRFIAESLEKQVGWDKSSYTAIIIDYDYFSDVIKQNNPSLYEVLASEKNTSFQITRNYIDKQNTSQNSTATLQGNVIKEEEYSEVTLDFSGTDELMKEIASEGWNHIVYQAQYEGNKIRVKSSNETFQKMLHLNAETFVEFDTQKMNLLGNTQNNLAKGIASLFQMEDKNLNISTFSKLKQDFDIFSKLLLENGSRDLKTQNQKMSILDFSHFDNMIYKHEMVRTLAFINQTIFHYDVLQDELLYDWKTIQYSLNCENNTLILKLALENEYNERVEYIVECK